MNGEMYHIEFYFRTKTGDYTYVTGIHQLSMDYKINPNMWEGQVKGFYSRATYVPDFIYANMQANGVLVNGVYDIVTIFTSKGWPKDGVSATLEELE